MKSASFYLHLAVLTFSFIIVGCGNSSDSSAAQQQTVNLTQSNSGTSVNLSQNQLLKVSLHGNASTGYAWAVISETESLLPKQGVPECVTDSSLTGAGGTYTFTFKAAAPGTAPLKLVYRRPWETGVAAAQTFEVTVVIQ
jgi:inhibitor of cysteine peptidase